jgi:hypothetical protein
VNFPWELEMASQTTVDSSEAVAYAVLEQIAEADGWCTTGFATGVIKWNKTRKEELPKNWTGLPPSRAARDRARFP